MSDERVRARQQRRVEDLCGATIRAVSGQPQLQWRGGRLWRGSERLPRFAPHLYPDFERADFGLVSDWAYIVPALCDAFRERLG